MESVYSNLLIATPRHAARPPAVAELNDCGDLSAAMTLFEQCAIAGPSFREETDRSQPLVPLSGRRLVNDWRLPGDEPNPPRASEVLGKRRYPRVLALLNL